MSHIIETRPCPDDLVGSLTLYPQVSESQLHIMTEQELTDLFVRKIAILHDTLPHYPVGNSDDINVHGAWMENVVSQCLPPSFENALPIGVLTDRMCFQTFSSDHLPALKIVVGGIIPVAYFNFYGVARYTIKIKDGKLLITDTIYGTPIVIKEDGKLQSLKRGLEPNEQELLATACFANVVADTIKAILAGDIQAKVSTS